MELALEWLASERRVMDNAHVRAGWFLRFPNGTVFNHPRYAHPGIGPLLNQYFIDWRNPDAADFFVSAIVNATRLPGVDATFLDDAAGVPMEHPEIGPALNMSAAELAAIKHATEAAGQRLVEALAAAGRTCWQCVGGQEAPTGGTWGYNQRRPPSEAGACARQMRRYCAPEMQSRGMFMEYDTGWNETVPAPRLYHNQTIAAFLVTRPPIAYLGTSYGLSDATWNPLFAMDVGVPLGLCTEDSNGAEVP